MNVSIIIAAIAAGVILLILIPVKLEILYNSDEITNSSSVLMKYGFIKYRIYPKKASKKTMAQVKDEKNEEEKKEEFSFDKKKSDIERYMRLFEKIKDDVIKLMSYATKRAVVFERVEIKSEFGFEDAMQTGIFTGIFNGFVYSVMGVIHNASQLKEMDIKLQPVFGKKCFNNLFFCILRIKTVHIIFIAFKALMIFRKIKKEGRI